MDSISNYIEPNESSLFDKATRLGKVDELSAPLARLDEVMDSRLFEPLVVLLHKGVVRTVTISLLWRSTGQGCYSIVGSKTR